MPNEEENSCNAKSFKTSAHVCCELAFQSLVCHDAIVVQRCMLDGMSKGKREAPLCDVGPCVTVPRRG